MNKVFIGGAAAMALVLALSNLLVLFPIGEFLTWSAFVYPMSFLVTDCVNRIAGASVARKVVIFGFVFGVPLSFVFAYFGSGQGALVAARVALASGTTFCCSQLLDVFLFDRIRRAATGSKSKWWLPPLVSSAPASVLDSFLFFALAFAGTGIAWYKFALGDLGAKLFMVFFLLPIYRRVTVRLTTA